MTAVGTDEPIGPSVILTTSGSSGTPRAVELPVEALRASAELAETRLGGPGLWLTDGVYDSFVEAIAEQARNTATTLDGGVKGDGFVPPVNNPAQLAKVLGFLERTPKHAKIVHIHEDTALQDIDVRNGSAVAHTPHATITAQRVALCTNAFRSPLPQVRRRVLPVYDYQLATEPLSADQWRAVGWNGFEGIKGAGNQFHYARRTADGRILWGGYDAVYHRGNGVGPRFERDDAMFAKLATHFGAMFPQLADVRFTHAWGGAIDTCSRFIPFWVQRGPLAAVAGFTGLGVGSSRFAAGVLLDLLDGRDSAASRLEMVRTLPLPFPPEPTRSAVVAMTRRSLARADARGGRRDLWLRLLDRLDLGFDS